MNGPYGPTVTAAHNERRSNNGQQQGGERGSGGRVGVFVVEQQQYDIDNDHDNGDTVQFTKMHKEQLSKREQKFGYQEKKSKNPPPQQPQQQQMMIEIGPGALVRLRGAEETWDCIQRDFYLPTQCSFCELILCCIQDASYVLCPQCRVVSPIDDIMEEFDGGAGIGFTFEQLHAWQNDIIKLAGQQQ